MTLVPDWPYVKEVLRWERGKDIDSRVSSRFYRPRSVASSNYSKIILREPKTAWAVKSLAPPEVGSL